MALDCFWKMRSPAAASAQHFRNGNFQCGLGSALEYHNICPLSSIGFITITFSIAKSSTKWFQLTGYGRVRYERVYARFNQMAHGEQYISVRVSWVNEWVCAFVCYLWSTLSRIIIINRRNHCYVCNFMICMDDNDNNNERHETSFMN